MYHHVTSSDSVSANPWEETNHAVVVVGWGVDDATQENYWIVKNSWGRHFGLTGYFYVRRSTDEIAIESMALSAGVWAWRATSVVCDAMCNVFLQNLSFSTWSMLDPIQGACEASLIPRPQLPCDCPVHVFRKTNFTDCLFGCSGTITLPDANHATRVAC